MNNPQFILTVSGTVDKIRRLMPTDQSRSINPLRLAKTEQRIDGSINLEEIDRLQGLVVDYSGELHYGLAFNIDEAGLCVVDSEINVSLMMECQRCLNPFIVEIHKRTSLGVVNNKDELNGLANDYEPLHLEDDVFNVDELVVDELLLAIPLSPLHSIDNCPGQKEIDRINAEAKRKPFAVLAALKKDNE